MIKSILLFIKAHTIATAITTTVVVSTVVATPVIINQVQKQPEQEIAQIQDETNNKVDNSVIEGNTITEPEANEVNNEVVNEVNNEAETPKENKPNQNTQTTPKTEAPKKDTPQTTTKPVEEDTTPNYVSLGSIQYDTNNKVVLSDGKTQDRATWLANYNSLRNSYEKSAREAMITDGRNRLWSKAYCELRIEEYKQEAIEKQEALDYYKAHKDEIELTDQNSYLYKGKYYEGHMEVAELYITVTIPRSIKDWSDYRDKAPEYSPNEKPIRDKIVELDKAYNYIKSH